MNTVTEQIFNHSRHSAASFQESVDQYARRIEQDIKDAILKDKSELHEIAGLAFSNMEEETLGFILLAMIGGDIGAIRSAQLMVVTEYQKAVRNTAELRAVRHVESMEPGTD